MTHTATPANIATQYLAVWNERDAAARRALVARAFSVDASYVDPMMRGAGHDGIDAMIAGAQGQFPGFRFELDGTPDGHNDDMRIGPTSEVPLLSQIWTWWSQPGWQM